MDFWIILGDVVALLATALLLGGLFSKFGQSPILGYLLAGMILGGPGSLNLIESTKEIEAISELGVALLLFGLGLEFSSQRLRALGSSPLIGGIIQVLLTIALGAAAAATFGLNIRQSIAFGAMISLSSTAVVLRMLMERSELEMPHGRNTLGVLLTQDMAVVPLALLMTILGGEGSFDVMLWGVGKLLLLIGALVVGLFLLVKIAVVTLGTLTLHRNRELTMLFAIVMGFGATCLAHYAGISPALGAFVAGMLLGSSTFATQIRADISPLRVVLLTLFFSAVGMVADPIWILEHWQLVAIVSILLVISKMLVSWAVFQCLGHSVRVAAATGFCLAQSGEFAFVLGSIGLASGVVTQDMYALVVSVTIVSFFFTAILVPAAPGAGNRIASFIDKKSEPEAFKAKTEIAPDVVIIGFGPSGKLAAQPLVDQNIRVTVIELNQKGVKEAEQLGFRGVIGDATQNDVLEHAQLNRCKIAIITVPHYRSAMVILENIRHLAQYVPIVVRSRYQAHANDFTAAGAHVIGDEKQVGECLAKHLQVWLDSDEYKKDETN